MGGCIPHIPPGSATELSPGARHNLKCEGLSVQNVCCSSYMSSNSVPSSMIDICNGPPIENSLHNVCFAKAPLPVPLPFLWFIKYGNYYNSTKRNQTRPKPRLGEFCRGVGSGKHVVYSFKIMKNVCVKSTVEIAQASFLMTSLHAQTIKCSLLGLVTVTAAWLG